MKKRIANRKTIFIVTEDRDDGGWILSRNVKAFYERESAEYFCNGLNDKNDDGDTSYNVEALELLELA